MPMKQRDLRDYQVEGVDYLLDRLLHPDRSALLISPTGSGKSAILRAAALQALISGNQVKGVVLITPSKQVETTFLEDATFTWTDTAGNVVMAIFDEKRKKDVHGCKDKKAAFYAFMKKPQGKILVTTHAQFVRWTIPKNTKRRLLIVDEGHHDGKLYTVLSSKCSKWHERGGFLWEGTATPFRADERPMLTWSLENGDVFRVPYTRLSLYHKFPRHLRLRELKLTRTWKTGILDPQDAWDIARYIYDQAEIIEGTRIQRPTVVNIAPGSTAGDALRHGEQVRDALVLQGIPADRILLWIGEDPKNADRDRVVLERQLLDDHGFQARTLDVIIACGRMLEGTDWPAASLILSLGISSSLTREAQKLGRGLRPKAGIQDYPGVWVYETVYVALVPDHPADCTTAKKEMALRVLELALFLECSEAMLDYARYWDRLTVGKRIPPAARNHSPPSPLDPRVVDAGLEILAICQGHIVKTGRAPAPHELVAAICASPLKPGTKLLAVQQVLLNSVGQNPAIMGDLKRYLRSVVRGLSKARVPNPRRYEDKALDDLRKIAEKHALLGLVQPYQHPVVSGYEGLLTPIELLQIAADLVKARDARMKDYTWDRILNNIITPYRKKHGHAPTTLPRNPQDPPNPGCSNCQDLSFYVNERLTACTLDRHIRRKGFDLDRLGLVALFGWMDGPPLTPADIKALGPQVYQARMELWPDAGKLMEAKGNRTWQVRINGRQENLAGLAVAALLGLRGLPGGQTLEAIAKSP